MYIVILVQRTIGSFLISSYLSASRFLRIASAAVRNNLPRLCRMYI